MEFAAPLGADFAGFAARMAEVGLDCPSAHVGLTDMADHPDAVLDMGRTLGCRYLVMPYVLPDQRDWTKVIDTLGAFARRARSEGFRVAYHHHDFEFETTDGVRPFDRLAQRRGEPGALAGVGLIETLLPPGSREAMAALSLDHASAGLPIGPWLCPVDGR